MGDSKKDAVFESVHGIVFKESEELADKCTKIEGYDFNKGVNHRELMRSLGSTGFQASNLWDAIEIVDQMVRWYAPISTNLLS